MCWIHSDIDIYLLFIISIYINIYFIMGSPDASKIHKASEKEYQKTITEIQEKEKASKKLNEEIKTLRAALTSYTLTESKQAFAETGQKYGLYQKPTLGKLIDISPPSEKVEKVLDVENINLEGEKVKNIGVKKTMILVKINHLYY